MKKIEKQIQQLETQILENHVTKERELLITEMKKIGIEKLPYSYSALKQFIDPETMNFHYNKHYKGYVDKLNDALSKKKYGDLELEQIIKTISRFDKTIRNNAGGAFNHALFWNMLTPDPKKLDGELYKKITKQWGTFTNFKKEFEKQAFKSKMILQVHDELLFDVHDTEQEEMKRLVKEAMEKAVDLAVPMEVEMEIANNWLEAH